MTNILRTGFACLHAAPASVRRTDCRMLSAAFCLGVSLLLPGCSAIRNTLHSNRSATAEAAAACAPADPACAAPGGVQPVVTAHPHLIPADAAMMNQPVMIPPVPGGPPELACYPPDGTLQVPLPAPSGGGDQSKSAEEIAACRREAEQMKHRLELVQVELDSYRRSNETMHLSHSTLATQLEQVARDNQQLQMELRRLQEASSRQHQSDLESLDALSQLIEQQMSGTRRNASDVGVPLPSADENDDE